MNYQEALLELEQRGEMNTQAPSLDPLRSALKKKGLYQLINPKKNIVIAGTNGKGSVAATLSSLLHSAGQRVGLYTSPHLVTCCERIRVCEKDISEEQFTAAYIQLKELIFEEKLSHFEALTLIAAFLFYSGELGISALDWIIWEVGVGGLYDATNVIPHDYCGITSLSLDHQTILGATLGEIALQKFGIIGKNAKVVYSPMQPSLSLLRTKIFLETGCEWICSKPVKSIGFQNVLTYWGTATLKLVGARAAENTATALTLFELIGFDPGLHLSALQQVRWPGRFSLLETSQFVCPIYLSGDHNVSGIESLLEILQNFKWQNLHLVIGIGRDKEVEEMLNRLVTLPRVRLYFTETPFKGTFLEDYPLKFKQSSFFTQKDVFQIFSFLKEAAQSQDLIVVTGSLYLIGKILSRKEKL